MLARAHIGVNTHTRDNGSMRWIADVVCGVWCVAGGKTIGHTPCGRDLRGEGHVGAPVVHAHIDTFRHT